jgi:hypothetical protein
VLENLKRSFMLRDISKESLMDLAESLVVSEDPPPKE